MESFVRFFRSFFASSLQSLTANGAPEIRTVTRDPGKEACVTMCPGCGKNTNQGESRRACEERIPAVMRLDDTRRIFGGDFETFERVFDPVEERDQFPAADDQIPETLREVYPEMYIN